MKVFNIKKWNCNKTYKLKRKGGVKMTLANIRENKIALNKLLMKNVKINNRGKVVISKDDEWRNENEWDELYRELKKQ